MASDVILNLWMMLSMRNLIRSLFPHGFRSMNYISISSYLTWQALDKLLGFWGSWVLQTRQLPDVWGRFKNLGNYGKLLASLVNLFFPKKKVWGQFCWNDFSQCIFDRFIYSGEVGWLFLSGAWSEAWRSQSISVGLKRDNGFAWLPMRRWCWERLLGRNWNNSKCHIYPAKRHKSKHLGLPDFPLDCEIEINYWDVHCLLQINSRHKNGIS